MVLLQLRCVCRFTREVVQRRRALISHQRATEPEPRRKKDFVDIILLSKVGATTEYNEWDVTQRTFVIVPMQDEDGQGLTDEEIQSEADTFMFAGEGGSWLSTLLKGSAMKSWRWLQLMVIADQIRLQQPNLVSSFLLKLPGNCEINPAPCPCALQAMTQQPAPFAGRCTI